MLPAVPSVSVKGSVESTQTPLVRPVVSCRIYELPDQVRLITPLDNTADSMGGAPTEVSFIGAGPVAGELMPAIIWGVIATAWNWMPET